MIHTAVLERKCQNYVLQIPIMLLGRVIYVKPSKSCSVFNERGLTAPPVFTVSALVNASVRTGQQ